ncbi:GMC family oxidoreductase [Gluconacetobacter sp. Hr-1-5]|uniref:GMC family oxidoreductase n=1 Tax=Gluconacetobacter sp. Hr-1-5 TaxID=3395370 RepID=UPI003B526015
MRTLPEVDILIVGMGWTGGIVARELAETGLRIVGLERGAERTTEQDFSLPHIRDELTYGVRMGLMQNVRRDTLSFRNSDDQIARPMRRLGSFLPGEGVGGSGVHWNGLSWRWSDNEFKIRSRYIERYGRRFIPDDMTIQDWGISYADLEPHYERFERISAVSGQEGRLGNQKIPGGNPYEEPRRHGYPLPPLEPVLASALFAKAAQEAGYAPFPVPVANASRPYVNPDGIPFGQCQYCGFCERFGCETNAKGSPHHTVIPAARRFENFELRTHARALRLRTTDGGRRATGVEYLDLLTGESVFQPAALIVLGAYALGNTHLLLTSDIGAPYDPRTGAGLVGKNYAYNTGAASTLFFEDRSFNPFIGAGGNYSAIDDFNGNWDFDRSTEGFVGGVLFMSGNTNGRPIGRHPVPPGTPRWGTLWKNHVAHYYQRNMTIQSMGSVMPSRRNYLDLDPLHLDPYGNRMLRLTFDFSENDRKSINFSARKINDIAAALKPDHVIPAKGLSGPYAISPYQGTHNTGGTIMGEDRTTGVVNKFGQCWDVPNLFIVGGSTLPHNAATNPTATLGAMAFFTADAIRHQYLRQPASLLPL